MPDDATLGLSDPAALLAGPRVPDLAPTGVHLWAWPLAGTASTLERARDILDGTERTRAGRLVRPGHRVRVVIAHGVLRAVLGRYTLCAPDALRFVAGDGGKPALDGAALAFNLSHSADRALLAVSRFVVGVDLEHERTRLDPLGLASRFFFGAEHAAIRDAPAAERAATFLRYWVSKEAVLKAQGVGLAFPLDAFAIVFARDGATARVTSTDPRRLSPAWTVRMLSVGAGWPAAVAAAGDDWTLVPCLAGSAA